MHCRGGLWLRYGLRAHLFPRPSLAARAVKVPCTCARFMLLCSLFFPPFLDRGLSQRGSERGCRCPWPPTALPRRECHKPTVLMSTPPETLLAALCCPLLCICQTSILLLVPTLAFFPSAAQHRICRVRSQCRVIDLRSPSCLFRLWMLSLSKVPGVGAFPSTIRRNGRSFPLAVLLEVTTSEAGPRLRTSPLAHASRGDRRTSLISFL